MITVVGLGPFGLDRLPAATRDLLADPERSVILRTLRHPAAEQLAATRTVVSCDDIYESCDVFADVYGAIVERIVQASQDGPVVYAVPGSPRIGEFAVRDLMARDDVEIVDSESFVDAVLGLVRYDPLDRGLQILNGHELPDPLVLDKPSIIGHLDHPQVLADVVSQIDAALQPGATVTIVVDAGSDDALVVESVPEHVDLSLAGLRTSLFVDSEPGGIIGAIHVMRRLREECPWDREQTHQTLVKNLIEETYELIEAISTLPEGGDEPDWVAYSQVEDELGDVLLQVLFHSVIGRQAGALDIESVAAVMTEKLVRRHPHVFADVAVTGPEEVKSNWDRIKAEERGPESSGSLLDGIPEGMPSLLRASKIQNRAAKVGFDWPKVEDVLAKLDEEVGEMREALSGTGDPADEMGDLLFTIVNLARHLDLDPELALRRSSRRFERRFRAMEESGSLEGLSLDDLDRLWEAAKSADTQAGSIAREQG